ncbi:hypothetical protein BM525_19360 (plasmid) [Alteromonas mediterranea]|uniref:Uncharacterized protein n=1 Tax=Alteromonas mediterranea TaxID=314275 RepID=A0AAC9NU36_9ALTE|nr:hypothetical protein [Alteromonas mediterranea]APD92042.1 hypothetical protein BM524_19165 [Alteromonas mediterranea]APD99896.1 hypothetical protein BM525_19360 [Alteromonas mediterranea]
MSELSMYKEGERLRFVKAHCAMNKHLKALEGEECVALNDSYAHGKTLVKFDTAAMKPVFNIASERLARSS